MCIKAYYVYWPQLLLLSIEFALQIEINNNNKDYICYIVSVVTTLGFTYNWVNCDISYLNGLSKDSP